MATSPSFESIDRAVEQTRPTIEKLASELWQLAELSLQEVKSARLIMHLLQEAGFQIVSQGTAKVPTAFIAEASVSYMKSTAINSFKIEFFGKGSHAGGAPWLGRSAVHAAELFAHGVNLMREHVEPTARIHRSGPGCPRLSSGGGMALSCLRLGLGRPTRNDASICFI